MADSLPAAVETKIAPHPDLVRDWRLYLAIEDFTDGSRSRVAKYLIPYDSEADGSAEGNRQYSGRLRRLENINFCGPFIKLHSAHMAQPIMISGADDPKLQTVLKDVTGFHDSYRQMARDRLYYYERDGKVGTLVDSAAQPAADRAVEQLSKDRSYQVLYTARQIRYWEYFESGPRKGQLKTLVLEEKPVFVKSNDKKGEGEWRCRLKKFEQPEPENAPFIWTLFGGKEALPTPISLDPIWSGRGDNVSQSQLWDKTTDIQAGEQDYEVIEPPRAGQLTYIPFVIWGEGPDESFIKDVVELNFIYLNKNSVHSNVLHNQGFQRLVAVGVAKEEVTKMNEYCLTLFRSEQARIDAVPPGDPVALEKNLHSLKSDIRRYGKFEYNQLADDSKESPSAESKARDLVARKAIYNETLDEQEEIEARIYKMHADFEGLPEADISVTIGREFGLDDPLTESQTSGLLFTQAQALGAKKLQWEILKYGASKIRFVSSDGMTEDEVREEVLKELDDAEQSSPANEPTVRTSLLPTKEATAAMFKPKR